MSGSAQHALHDWGVSVAISEQALGAPCTLSFSCSVLWDPCRLAFSLSFVVMAAAADKHVGPTIAPGDIPAPGDVVQAADGKLHIVGTFPKQTYFVEPKPDGGRYENGVFR